MYRMHCHLAACQQYSALTLTGFQSPVIQLPCTALSTELQAINPFVKSIQVHHVRDRCQGQHIIKGAKATGVGPGAGEFACRQAFLHSIMLLKVNGSQHFQHHAVHALASVPRSARHTDQPWLICACTKSHRVAQWPDTNSVLCVPFRSGTDCQT